MRYKKICLVPSPADREQLWTLHSLSPLQTKTAALKKNNNNVLKAIVAYRTEIHPWNGNKTIFGNINSPRLLPQILHWPQITPPIVPTGGLPAPIQTQLLTFTALFKLHFLFDCVCSRIVRMRESEDDTCMSKSKGNS